MSPIRKIHTFIQNDTFLKNNAIFFIGSLSVAFLNYLYYPVMSRVLSVEEFGEVQTIFSLVFLSGVVMTVFRMIVLNITTNSTTTEHQKLGSDAHTIPALFTTAHIFHVPFMLVLFFGSPFISHFFSFSSSWAFSIFSLYIYFSVASTFYGAYLNGKNDFTSLTISQIIGAGGKLIISFILVSLGFGVLGAISALVLISLITIFYMRTKSDNFSLSFIHPKKIKHALIKELPFGLLVFFTLGLVTILYSADVLIIKRLFSPEVAGLYSGIATIARIIFFATGSISAVLLSSVTIDDIKKTNASSLKKALLLITAIGGSILIFFSLFPTFTISLLVGTKYASYAHLLPLVSLYTFLVSVLNLFVIYLLALRSYTLFKISGIGFVSLVLSLFFGHSTPSAIVISFIISILITLTLSGISILSIFKNRPHTL